MRSVSVRLADFEKHITLPIGFEGENEFTVINVDCKKIFNEHPNAVPVLSVTPPQGDSYPAVVVRDGDIVSWTVTASDLIYEGSGEIQFAFTIGETMVGKTYKARTKIFESITPSGTVPTPIENWLVQAAAALQALPQEVADAVMTALSAVVGVGETLDPGENVTVSFDGQTLTIGVPKGEKGDPGEDGHSPVVTASKSGKVTTISVDGSAIATINDGEDGHSPVVTASKVGKVTTVSVDGTAIATINDGEDGDDGYSPTATVSKVGKVATISITDKNGTTTATVSDGEDADPSTIIDDNAGSGDTDKVWSADKTSGECSSLKNEITFLNSKYFTKNFSSSSETIVDTNTGIIMSANEQIVLVQKATTTACTARIYGQSSSEATDIKTKGTYTFTAPFAGELILNHRAADVDIYYPDFAIVSERGSSKMLAASQYLVETAFDAVGELDDDVDELSDQLNGKYDRYKMTEVDGLSLNMFDIKPSQYQVVQYNNSDCLYFTNISPASYCFSKFKSDITDIKCTIGSSYMTKTDATGTYIAVACTAEKAIALGLNLTVNTVLLYTSSSRNNLTSVYRNSNCRTVTVGDTIRLVRNGTKVAMYLIDNGTEVPILADEFIDVYELYGAAAGITESDVCIGFASANSSRGEYLVYDFVQTHETGDHFVSYDMGIRNGLIPDKTVDLFMFMGQSNMAGRGTGSQAPKVIDGAGYEFRAVTDQTKLYNIVEPFGQNENVANAIDDSYNSSSMKSGDMIPAFVNAYYEHTKCPIVGVSASEGGTRIAYWQPETARDEDAEDRYDSAVAYLTANGYTIRHKYMLWCQGETDGDISTTKADYKTMFTAFAEEWFSRGIETIFIIKIGNYNGESGYDYNTIMTAQNEICQEMANVVMVCTDFAGMKVRGLMKDAFHYKQEGYNEVGTYAGINTAIYVNTGKEPTMYDTQDESLYFSHKN